jgi:hypothetical protein
MKGYKDDSEAVDRAETDRAVDTIGGLFAQHFKI